MTPLPAAVADKGFLCRFLFACLDEALIGFSQSPALQAKANAASARWRILAERHWLAGCIVRLSSRRRRRRPTKPRPARAVASTEPMRAMESGSLGREAGRQ